MTTQTKSSTLRKAGLFYLVFVMFSYTTGGPFGLEDMVTTSGPGMTLLYLLVLPFFWCIPVSLVSAELTTAMPVEGGFYRWTRAAFGDFWGFLAGWWNWSASFLLGGAYAVLFTDYLVYYFPKMTWWEHYLVSVALIALLTWINVRGIQMVGQVATALEIFIFIPVMTMIVIAPARTGITIHFTHGSFRIRRHSKFSELDWHWDCGSTPDTNSFRPWRKKSKTRRGPIRARWHSWCRFRLQHTSCRLLQDWPQLAIGKNGILDSSLTPPRMIGGPWLGTWMTLAAMVGNVALLNSTILTTTRMPFAMAEDGYLPVVLTRKHRRYGTPWLAIRGLSSHLCPARMAEPGTFDFDLYLAAIGDDGADRVVRLEASPQQAGAEAIFYRSRWRHGTCSMSSVRRL